MAFFDDPKVLTAHLRHSFITSDDTGKLASYVSNILPFFKLMVLKLSPSLGSGLLPISSTD